MNNNKKKSEQLGMFKTPEEAANAYDSALLDLDGKDALTNRKLGLLK